MATFWVRAGAGILFLAVAAGAFGAHALKNVLDEPMKAVYETAGGLRDGLRDVRDNSITFEFDIQGCSTFLLS